MSDSRRTRHYNLCMAINLTSLSVELRKLEHLGVEPRILSRLKDRAGLLLDDVLDLSDRIIDE